MENFGQEETEEDEVEYELETFQIYDYCLEITTVAYLPITTLMNNREKDKEISGQKLWCGSLCVMNYLFKNPDFLKDSSVIELGAGTGVLSIIASKLGASVTIATDYDPLSLKHMADDFPRNRVDVQLLPLNWYEPHVESIASILHQHPEIRNVKILAGDVLYKSVLMDPFFDTVKRLLQIHTSIHSELILCHIPRADVSQDRVQSKLNDLKFAYQPISVEAWNYGDLLTTYCPIEDVERAQMYHITL